MALIRELKLIARGGRRLGAFKRARQKGMSVEDARAYSDQLCPPTADDIAYEDGLRSSKGVWVAARYSVGLSRTARRSETGVSGFPWFSALSLLYPIGATIYIATRTPAPPIMIAGYGLANFGYLLFAAGVFTGTFGVFGLKKRWQILMLAVVCFAIGTLLSNID